MKKGLVILLVLTMIFSFAACGKSKTSGEGESPKNPDVVLVTDESGLGDDSVNDAAWAGCSKAADEFKIEIYCIESKSAEDYIASISSAVGMQPQLIICATPNLEYALMEVATQHPEQNFAIIDTNEIGDNVSGITFKEQEGAFLAGIAAGMMTESKIVSFIGGEMSVKLDRFQYGYDAGVASIDNTIYVNNQYIGSFSKADDARMIAGAHAALGSDVIFGVAGGGNKGVLEAASSREAWFIGVGVDNSDIAKETMLCTMIKKYDTAAYKITEKLIGGTFDGTDVEYSLSDDALEIRSDNGNLPEEIANTVGEYAEKIKNGEITVPYDWQTCYEYKESLN